MLKVHPEQIVSEAMTKHVPPVVTVMNMGTCQGRKRLHIACKPLMFLACSKQGRTVSKHQKHALTGGPSEKRSKMAAGATCLLSPQKISAFPTSLQVGMMVPTALPGLMPAILRARQ